MLKWFFDWSERQRIKNEKQKQQSEEENLCRLEKLAASYPRLCPRCEYPKDPKDWQSYTCGSYYDYYGGFHPSQWCLSLYLEKRIIEKTQKEKNDNS